MRLPCSILVIVLSACGTDADTQCSTASYATVGEPYMVSWCRGCHSADLAPAMRQNAPVGLDFDTLAAVRAQLVPIEDSIANATMPPSGGPSTQDTQIMMTWLSCGAP